MTITFYVNQSDNRVITKSLSQLGTATLTLKDDTNIMTPEVKVATTQNVLDANYCYIDGFNRYYYIVDKTYSQQHMFLTLRCDVLMSHAAEIKACTCTARRSTSKYNSYINDPEYPQLAYTQPVTITFPDPPFSKTWSLVVTIAGGS